MPSVIPSNLLHVEMAKTQYIVIVGCGRLGATLANRLSHLGHSVVVVDHAEAAFRALSSGFGGFQIVGDAGELSVLKQANIHKADALLAVTGEDTLNLMVAQVAQSVFQVKQVLARVFDPSREAIYQAFDIATISPTSLAADQFMAQLESRALPPVS
jgi:trk system potassium uptake protein TrkA